MQPIRIQATPPRDIAAYRDIVKRGLGPYFFFGWFSITGPAIPTAMMLAHAIIGDAPEEIFVPGVIAFVVAGAILGTILLRSGSNIKRERELALSRGVMIPATVLAHGRAFAFYKSVRDYTLTVEYAGRTARSSAHRTESSTGMIRATRSWDCETKRAALFSFPPKPGANFTPDGVRNHLKNTRRY